MQSLHEYQLQKYSQQSGSSIYGDQVEIKLQQGIYSKKSQVMVTYNAVKQLVQEQPAGTIINIPSIYSRQDCCPLVAGQCQISDEKRGSMFQVDNLLFHQLLNYQKLNQKDSQISQLPATNTSVDYEKQVSLKRIGACNCSSNATDEKTSSYSISYKFTDFFPGLIQDDYFYVQNTMVFRFYVKSVQNVGLKDGLCKDEIQAASVTQPLVVPIGSVFNFAELVTPYTLGVANVQVTGAIVSRQVQNRLISLTANGVEQLPTSVSFEFNMLRYQFNPRLTELKPMFSVQQQSFINQSQVNYVFQQDCIVQLSIQNAAPVASTLYQIDDLYDQTQAAIGSFSDQVSNNLVVTFNNRQIISSSTQQQSRQQFNILKDNSIYNNLTAELGFTSKDKTLQINSLIPYNIYITYMYI